MSAPALGPRARAALQTAIRAAFDTGVAHARHRSGTYLDQVQSYARNLIETAMITDAAEAEAGVQDPHA